MIKTNQEKISVIIPIYNAGIYLRRCLDSVLSQTYNNLDIFLIDDGSTDNSNQICKEYINKDKRFKLVEQENKGLSCARNAGIDLNNNNYIVFVDADDEILPTMIEDLYLLLKDNDADISICSFQKLKDKKEFKQETNITVWSFEGNSKYQQIWSDYVRTVVQWNKLYKKEIFDNLRYPEGRVHEDEHIIHHELYNAKKIIYTNKILYLYYDNPGSITNDSSIKNNHDAALGFYDRITFFDKLNMHNYLINSYHQAVWYIDDVLNHIDSKDNNEWIKKLIDLKIKIIKEYGKYNKGLCSVVGKIKNLLFLIKAYITK